MLKKAIFLFFIYFSVPALAQESCAALFQIQIDNSSSSSFKDVGREIVAQTLEAFQNSKVVTPEKLQELAKLMELVLVHELDTKSIADAEKVALTIPSERRATFVKMAEMLQKARQGNVDQLVIMMDNLLQKGRYSEWLDFMANMHLMMQNHSVTYDARGFFPESSSIVNYAQRMGVKAYDPNYIIYTKPLPWESESSLNRHFKKRTRKDGYAFATPENLRDAANDFILSQRRGQILFIRDGSTVVKYDINTKELAIISANNEIITYYILDPRYRSPSDMDEYISFVFLSPPGRLR